MRQRVLSAVIAAIALTAPVPGEAQEPELRAAAARIRAAWIAHDVEALVESESVTLRLRSAEEEAGPIPRSQAARILERYLRPASEVAFDLRTVRLAGAGHGYAEATRRFVVRGTSDPMTETVLLGFRLSDGRWWLSEVRVTS